MKFNETKRQKRKENDLEVSNISENMDEEPPRDLFRFSIGDRLCKFEEDFLEATKEEIGEESRARLVPTNLDVQKIANKFPLATKNVEF